MPIFNLKQVKYYKTRKEVLQIFRTEENKKCYCSVEVWAGVSNKKTCGNCDRKRNLSKELDCKEFFSSNKNLKYWKIRRQGRYKELKLAPVYSHPQFVGYVTLPQEKLDKLMDDMHLSFEEESDHGWDDEE